MSATMKNSSGKIRLVEISETVSCNCSFVRGSDICLHIIWVLMNVLHVNEHDKLLHQKTHSTNSVVKMFRHCEANTVPTQAAAIGTLIGTAAPQHNLRPSQAQAALRTWDPSRNCFTTASHTSTRHTCTFSDADSWAFADLHRCSTAIRMLRNALAPLFF